MVSLEYSPRRASTKSKRLGLPIECDASGGPVRQSYRAHGVGLFIPLVTRSHLAHHELAERRYIPTSLPMTRANRYQFTDAIAVI